MSRVAVLVSGGGTNLQALIDARTNGEMPHAKLVLVVASSGQAGALQRAQRAGIPARVIERADCAAQQEFDTRLLQLLRQYRIEVVVLAGFLSILGPVVLNHYAGRIINIHPSLLPAFGGQGFYGLRVHKAALERGVKITGATVHLVNEVVDGGEILMQQAVAVQPQDTPETLQRRVMEEAEWQLLPRAVELVCQRQEGGYAD